MKTYPLVNVISWTCKIGGVIVVAFGMLLAMGYQLETRPIVFLAGLLLGALVYSIGQMLIMARDIAKDISLSTEADMRTFKKLEEQPMDEIRTSSGIKRLKRGA